MAGLIPATIAAGVDLDIGVALDAYPAPEWQLTLIMRGPAAIDVASTDDGTGHRLTASGSVTATWARGSYWWQIRATDGVAIVAVAEGTTAVTADLAAVTGVFDGRTHVDRVLSAIEATIEGRATSDQLSYRINGRELQRTPLSELMSLRSQYQAEQRRQQQASRSGQSLFGRTIRARMT